MLNLKKFMLVSLLLALTACYGNTDIKCADGSSLHVDGAKNIETTTDLTFCKH